MKTSNATSIARLAAGAARAAAAILAFLALVPLPGRAADAPAEPSPGEKLFALKVKPLFAEKCNGCHGDDPEDIEGDFDMRSRESILQGGETFTDEVLIPGKGKDSFLYLLSTRAEEDYEMPPKEAEKLSKEQEKMIRDWIDAGAPWPDDQRVAWIQKKFADGVVVKTSGGLSRDWTDRRYKPESLWAYRPVKRPRIPGAPGRKGEGDAKTDPTGLNGDPTGSSRAPNPVDSFIDARLQAAGLKAAPRADARTLIRRATFDLTGLPPTPAEVRAFETATAEDAEAAWKALIERLLASPRYGEQWGRHWLDVVRYADSSGFANDWERPNAWRYRDYVIRSFNADKPYDRFIREQIAGDEISGRADPELLVATGFLRMGAWEHTGMSVAKVTRQLFLDDVTNSVGQVFLGHTLLCAKCHDHKFDPVPTRDYYAVQAVFATTQFAEVETPWLEEENRAGMAEDRRYHEKRAAANRRLLDELEEKRRRYDAAWFRERGLPWKTREEAKKAGAKPADLPEGKGFKTADEFGRGRIARKWDTRLSWEKDRYQPVAYTVYNGKTRDMPSHKYQTRVPMPADPMQEGTLENTAILAGGSPFSPGDPVDPGVLSAVAGGSDVELPETVAGRRTALADWIADPENSLTARVMVNRIWLYHFGRGIAANANNFGTTGKKPTHPKLLDWLAAEFVERGWSVKDMHRLIMMSAAYRRAGAHPDADALKEKNAEDDGYAVFRPRRLAAEEIRDAMLAVSGELNLDMGGIPARPDMNLEAALQPRLIMGTYAPSYVPNPKPAQRNRRTIYAHKARGQRDPFLEVFNQPTPDLSCGLRDSSNVTPQVFTLFNSEESMDRALAFAARVLKESAGRPDEAAVARAFRLAFGREPASAELAESLAHWREMERVQAAIEHRPRQLPPEVERTAYDENTGKIFTFTERLFVYDDYQPDLQPHEVDARTRGFADLCLVLFNSNEFAYVY